MGRNSAITEAMERISNYAVKEHLSKIEEKVVVFKLLGLRTKDIAPVMFVCEGTVHAHLAHIYEKFNLHSEIELMHWYFENHKMINLKNLLIT